MADGILTPAVSVTSAAGGIAVAKPSISGSVTGIALVGVSSPLSRSCPSLLNIEIGFSHPIVLCATFRHRKDFFHLRSR